MAEWGFEVQVLQEKHGKPSILQAGPKAPMTEADAKSAMIFGKHGSGLLFGSWQEVFFGETGQMSEEQG